MLENFKFQILRATEKAAIAAYEYIGKGDKLNADLAAVEAIRNHLDTLDGFSAVVKVSEGEKDESHMLHLGERSGKNDGISSHLYEIIADPIDGTTQTSKFGYEAMSVIVLTEKDSVNTINCHYMNKLAVGPKIAKSVKDSFLEIFSLSNPTSVILQKVSKILQKPISDITVCVLDRPRHNTLVKEIREIGAKIRFIPDCDLSAAIATCIGDIDILLGVGGQPETYLSAAALKCLGGFQQCQVCDKDGKVAETKIYTIDDLITKDVIFSATSITDSNLLKMKGIRKINDTIRTQSLLISSSGIHKIHSFI